LAQELHRRLQQQAAEFAVQTMEMTRQTTRIAELEQDRKAQFVRMDALEQQAAELRGREVRGLDGEVGLALDGLVRGNRAPRADGDAVAASEARHAADLEAALALADHVRGAGQDAGEAQIAEVRVDG